MERQELEKRLRMRIPERHWQAMLDSDDPIHKACEFLVPIAQYPLLDILYVNHDLHNNDIKPWPSFLVAFATEGCGDYFVYDLRESSPRVVYIEPIGSIADNLASQDDLEFDCFESWYDYVMQELRNNWGYEYQV